MTSTYSPDRIPFTSKEAATRKWEGDGCPRFDYCVVEFSNYKEFGTEASALGAQGWQLVTVDTVRLQHQVIVGYFMRGPLPAERKSEAATRDTQGEMPSAEDRQNSRVEFPDQAAQVVG